MRHIGELVRKIVRKAALKEVVVWVNEDRREKKYTLRAEHHVLGYNKAHHTDSAIEAFHYVASFGCPDKIRYINPTGRECDLSDMITRYRDG